MCHMGIYVHAAGPYEHLITSNPDFLKCASSVFISADTFQAVSSKSLRADQ